MAARAMGLLMAAVLVGVCPGQVTPPTGAAKVITLMGQVTILRDAQPWALSVGDSVQLQQVILTGPDGFAIFQVSDGSTFEVYPNSQVVFRKNPGNWKDLLDVLLGHVKVHIEKWGGQPNHNRVLTPTAVISVRGTTFHVEVEDDDATTLVVVDEGQVEVQHARKPGTPKVLNAGEYLRVYKNQPIATRTMDKGAVLQAAYRALSDALYTIVNRGGGRFPGGVGGSIPGGSGGGGGVSLPGDTTVPLPPPPPPNLPGDAGGSAPPPPPPPAH
jgi:hypothetical protein